MFVTFLFFQGSWVRKGSFFVLTELSKKITEFHHINSEKDTHKEASTTKTTRIKKFIKRKGRYIASDDK